MLSQIFQVNLIILKAISRGHGRLAVSSVSSMPLVSDQELAPAQVRRQKVFINSLDSQLFSIEIVGMGWPVLLHQLLDLFFFGYSFFWLHFYLLLNPLLDNFSLLVVPLPRFECLTHSFDHIISHSVIVVNLGPWFELELLLLRWNYPSR